MNYQYARVLILLVLSIHNLDITAHAVHEQLIAGDLEVEELPAELHAPIKRAIALDFGSYCWHLANNSEQVRHETICEFEYSTISSIKLFDNNALYIQCQDIIYQADITKPGEYIGLNIPIEHRDKIAYSNDGQLLAVYNQGAISIYTLDPVQQIQQILSDDQIDSEITAAALSGDHNLLVIGLMSGKMLSYRYDRNSNTFSLQTLFFREFSVPITAFSLAALNEYWAVGSLRGARRSSSYENMPFEAFIAPDYQVDWLNISPNGELVLTRLQDAVSNKKLAFLYEPFHNRRYQLHIDGLPISACCAHKNYSLLAAGTMLSQGHQEQLAKLVLFSRKDMQKIFVHILQHAVTDIALSADAMHIIFCYENKVDMLSIARFIDGISLQDLVNEIRHISSDSCILC